MPSSTNRRDTWKGCTVHTIGHSTRSWTEFVSLLEANGIRELADIRTLPGSKKHPQFNQKNMREALAKAGILYAHIPELGGRRRARPDSTNTAWRNASFRGYADYLATESFESG